MEEVQSLLKQTAEPSPYIPHNKFIYNLFITKSVIRRCKYTTCKIKTNKKMHDKPRKNFVSNKQLQQ